MAARPLPGFVTGTSSEYLGKRPLRRIVRERPVVLILGPRGSGKSAVARRIATHDGKRSLYLDTADLQERVLRRTRHGAWGDAVLKTPSLVLDGPIFLRSRPAVSGFLRELIDHRREAGLRTVICQVADDGSVETLMADLPVGSSATVGLRFPRSRSGRMRFARRCCDELGLSRLAARGTDAIEPWGYDAVISELQRLREDALP